MTAYHFIDGQWHEGNPMILGPLTHATWMASVVFDGARAFEGVTPDLDQHCARLNRSAENFGLKALHPTGEMLEIAKDGLAKFDKDAALYIRPMYWAEDGFVAAEADSTRFCFSIFDAPLPDPEPFAVCKSSYMRPMPNMAPTNAKASCLYPNSGLALKEAASRGFDNAIVLDGLGNVAELATANLWIGKDGAAHTPVDNGTFLSGITRARVAKLLRDAGVEVHERTLTWADIMDADEVFSTGNYGKVLPINRVEDRHLQAGPIYTQARELYWEFSHA